MGNYKKYDTRVRALGKFYNMELVKKKRYQQAAGVNNRKPKLLLTKFCIHKFVSKLSFFMINPVYKHPVREEETDQ